MSAMGKILPGTVNSRAISDIVGQSDRVDVANEVSLGKGNVSAVQRCSRSNADCNAHLQIFHVFFLVWSD